MILFHVSFEQIFILQYQDKLVWAVDVFDTTCAKADLFPSASFHLPYPSKILHV